MQVVHARFRVNVAIHHIYIILPQVTLYIEPSLRPGGQDKDVVTFKDKKRNETHFLYLTLTVTLSPDPNHLTTRTTVHTVRVNVMHVPHHSTHAQYNVSMTYATFTPGPAPCTNLSRR